MDKKKDFRIKATEGKHYIFDSLRKKFVVLTPEEWVRQHFIAFLIEEKGYPKSLIKVEGGLRYASLLKRFDVLVFDRQGQPFLLVECKAQTVSITQEALYQATRYNSQLNAPYMAITNGRLTYVFEINHQTRQMALLSEIPDFI